MIRVLTDLGYTVTHHSGGPFSKEELNEANENGIYYEGQVAPEGVTLSAVPAHRTEENHIVRVEGHGVDTTIYIDDEESIQRLVEAREE